MEKKYIKRLRLKAISFSYSLKNVKKGTKIKVKVIKGKEDFCKNI